MIQLGPRGVFKAVLGYVIAGARVVPGLGSVVDKEIEKELDGMRKKLLGDGDPRANTALPAEGRTKKNLLAEVRELKDKEKIESGKSWFGVYHEVTGDTVMEEIQHEVWGMYNNSNALYPTVFPSIRKYEAEIVAMCVDLLHGSNTPACGLLTSGGTESILLAVYSYREQARARGIEHPEIICARSAHGALDKGCKYFGIKLVKVTPDANFQLSPADVKASITRNTIAVYASAPSFPHGRVDPIEDLAALLKPLNIGLHVDNCLGGFILSFLQREGLFDRKFDFEVDGVTSISMDVHKYGYAPKGSSCVLFSSPELRRLTYCAVTSGLTMYITPTLQGSRSGAQIAAAWATMMHMGADGYAGAARRMHGMQQKVEQAVEGISGLRLLTHPDACIIPITSDDFDIFAVATLMERRGWNVFTSQDPSAMGLCLGEQHMRVLDLWIEDLRKCAEEVRKNPSVKIEGDAAVYSAAKQLPDSVLSEVMKSYIDIKMSVKPCPKSKDA